MKHVSVGKHEQPRRQYHLVINVLSINIAAIHYTDLVCGIILKTVLHMDLASRAQVQKYVGE